MESRFLILLPSVPTNPIPSLPFAGYKKFKTFSAFLSEGRVLCGGYATGERRTERQESAHSIPRRINVYVTPCACDSIYEFHVLQKLWCTDQNLMYSAYGLVLLCYLCDLRKGKERGKPPGAVTLSLFKPEQKEGLYFQELGFFFLLARQ